MSRSDPVEIVPVPTVYVDGLGTVALMPSGNARVTFVEDQAADGKTYRVIVARLTIPQDALVRAALAILHKTDGKRLPLATQDGTDARH